MNWCHDEWSAHFHVLISGGFFCAYEMLSPEFMRTSAPESRPDPVRRRERAQTIAAQLVRGAAADVVILSREGLNELIAAEKLPPEPTSIRASPARRWRARGDAEARCRTVEAFKQVLLAAKTVAVPQSTSGIWLLAELFPRLGIADKISVRPAPRGADATRMVAAGEADLAVQPVSEILLAPGVDFAGRLAPEIQFVQVFSAAMVAGSHALENSRRLIAFLASARAAEAIKNSGMEPLAAAR